MLVGSGTAGARPIPVTSHAGAEEFVVAAGKSSSRGAWSAFEGLLDVALGLVGSAFGLQFLVVGGPPESFLGLSLELLGLVARLVVGSHAVPVLSLVDEPCPGLPEDRCRNRVGRCRPGRDGYEPTWPSAGRGEAMPAEVC